MAKTYIEKLRDPRWQRRRLEVLNAANFKCRDCRAADKTLHIHHAYYERGRDPWDYPSDSLLSLCDECHDDRQSWQNWILRELAILDMQDIERVYGMAVALADWASGKPGLRACEADKAGEPISRGYRAAEALVD